MIIDERFIYLLSLFLAINFIAFLIILIDKIKSTNTGSERVSEGMMFFMATAFGALGVYLGMFVFKHKTRKWYFLVGIPLLIAQNGALVYVIFMYFSQIYSNHNY